MNDDKDQLRQESPFVLVGDHGNNCDKRSEMHFEQAVHLVNKLGHEYPEHQATYILDRISFFKYSLCSEVEDQAQAANTDTHKVGFVKNREQKSECKIAKYDSFDDLVRFGVNLLEKFVQFTCSCHNLKN